MKVKPFFRWYDLWIGMYIDRHCKTAYICPLPMVGISINFEKKFNKRIIELQQNNHKDMTMRDLERMADYNSKRTYQIEDTL